MLWTTFLTGFTPESQHCVQETSRARTELFTFSLLNKQPGLTLKCIWGQPVCSVGWHQVFVLSSLLLCGVHALGGFPFESLKIDLMIFFLFHTQILARRFLSLIVPEVYSGLQSLQSCVAVGILSAKKGKAPVVIQYSLCWPLYLIQSV